MTTLGWSEHLITAAWTLVRIVTVQSSGDPGQDCGIVAGFKLHQEVGL